MSQPLWQPRTDRAARLVGAGFFVVGAALLGYQAHVVIRDVTAHAEQVSYFMAAIALGLMAVLLGGYWLLNGLAGYTAVRALQNDPRRIRILFIATVIVMIAIIGGLKIWLSSLGYS